MQKSKVYFTNMRCPVGTPLLYKLDQLICKAGISEIDFSNRFVAIKIHFGEPGNLSFLRPNFAKTVADRIKVLGGNPFLTDCCTLYVGRRNNALLHLDAAMENGFSPLSTGCQIIIGDGLKGTDDVEVPIYGGQYLETAMIGRTIMDADIIVSLNHFKGHEVTGFGGALKNLGMGCGSRAGKMIMHNDNRPQVCQDTCVGCRFCARFCAHGAIDFTNGKASIDTQKCAGCGRCVGSCNFNAIISDFSSGYDMLSYKIVEYANAVLYGRPHFHISIVNQVSPYCDCHEENDAAIVPDIGMFASFDPVALDKACIDAVNAAPALKGTILDGVENRNDHFTSIHPGTDWRVQIKHAEKLALGSSDYELITLK